MRRMDLELYIMKLKTIATAAAISCATPQLAEADAHIALYNHTTTSIGEIRELVDLLLLDLGITNSTSIEKMCSAQYTLDGRTYSMSEVSLALEDVRMRIFTAQLEFANAHHEVYVAIDQDNDGHFDEAMTAAVSGQTQESVAIARLEDIRVSLGADFFFADCEEGEFEHDQGEMIRTKAQP